MRTETSPLRSLIPAPLLARLEQANMPYTGYHLLRETLFTRLLGESEASILYWLGRDLGTELNIQSEDDLVLTFIQLGLGKLEPVKLEKKFAGYRLSHPQFMYYPAERLSRSLALECGIVAGALSRLHDPCPLHGQFLVVCAKDSRPEHALITIEEKRTT
ncbi:DUF2507 domain-containing protein [Brevibacillus fluminis]|uniref:DUF2507 domain-containing protein n=1 Tax=Brevibacillus fluminis TaxID=511487 RepID=UPI003F8B5B62